MSFGAERDAAFEHAKNRCVVSMPQVRTSELRYLFILYVVLLEAWKLFIFIIYIFHISSPMEPFIRLDVMLTFYGGMESVNYHQKCSTMKEEYLLYVGGGVKLLICSYGVKNKKQLSNNNLFSNNNSGLWMKHVKTKQM